MEQYERLAEVMRTSQGQILVTINYHPDMRKVSSGFDFKVVDIGSIVGGAGKGKSRKELLIQSW